MYIILTLLYLRMKDARMPNSSVAFPFYAYPTQFGCHVTDCEIEGVRSTNIHLPATFGPYLLAHVEFPEAGLYRLFSQMLFSSGLCSML